MKKFEGRTFLLVDDEIGILEILKEEFEYAGAKVLTANDGLTALAIVESQKVDAIVSDINMPGGGGLQLLDSIRKRCAVAPVLLFMTGFAHVTADEILDRGAEGMFAKPFRIRDLVLKLESLLTPPHDRESQVAFDAVEVTLELNLSHGIDTPDAHGKGVQFGRIGFFLVARSIPLWAVDQFVRFSLKFGDGQADVLHGLSQVRWVRTQATNDLIAGSAFEILWTDRSYLDLLPKKLPIAAIPRGRTEIPSNF